MSRKQDFLTMLKEKKTPEKTPLWELHFQMWKHYDARYATGRDFDLIPEEKKAEAIRHNAHVMKTVGEQLGFSCVSIPDNPWDCIYTLPDEYRCMLVRELKALNPDFAVIAGCSGVISMPSSSDDYVEFCYRIMDEPELIDEECEIIYAAFEKNAANLIDAGVDAIYMAADVADNRTTFFNPEQLKRWYYPYLTKCVDYLHARQICAILHTDGNISSILNELLACGIDGLQAIDPIAGMDLCKVLDCYDGKAVVCGNLDCGKMLMGKPEEVYELAKEILLAGKGKSLIFGCSNAVVPETPMENYIALLKAWEQFA